MIPTSALTFFAALAIVAILTPITRSLALRLEVLDQPHPRKIHASPKPLLGGVAIYLSVVLSLLLTVEAASLSQMISLIAAATLLVAVGLVDDFVSLNARLKLFVAIPLAGLALAIGGFRITTFPLASLLAGSPEAALVISYVLTVLWVVGITSAFAILDHNGWALCWVGGPGILLLLAFRPDASARVCLPSFRRHAGRQPGFSEVELQTGLHFHGG